MDYNYAIILVLIILIIGYYLYSTGTSSTNNNNDSTGTKSQNNSRPSTPVTCTGDQICVTTASCETPPSATTMFEFFFEFKNAYSWQQFSDILLDNNGTNCYHRMVIEDTSQKSIGSGILYQYFDPTICPDPTNPPWGSGALCSAQSSAGPYAMLICPSTYSPNNTSNTTINKYIGVVVNYYFSDKTLAYTKENVMNVNNVKNIVTNISDSNASTNSYAGVCDLTDWYTSITNTGDQDLVGVFTPGSKMPTVNGSPGIDPWTSDMPFVRGTTNGSVTSIYTNTGYPNGIPYGITILSYYLNSTSTIPPYDIVYL